MKCSHPAIECRTYIKSYWSSDLHTTDDITVTQYRFKFIIYGVNEETNIPYLPSSTCTEHIYKTPYLQALTQYPLALAPAVQMRKKPILRRLHLRKATLSSGNLMDYFLEIKVVLIVDFNLKLNALDLLLDSMLR